jgi:complex III assembly factor LYRM7
VLDAARQQIRQGFRDKASLPASDPSIQPAIQHAEEVASFLKTNVVQGRREGNTYSEWAFDPALPHSDLLLILF